MMSAPMAPRESKTEGPPGPGHRRSRSHRRRESLLESDDWMSPHQEGGQLAESKAAIARLLAGGEGRGTADAPKPAKAASRWRAWLEMLKPVKGPQAPGQERIVSSPVVLGLVACFLVLVALIAGLFAIIAATAATRAFNQGVQDYDDGDYRTAIRDFDGFLAKNPEDPRTGKARVLRAMANVRQFVSVEGGNLVVGSRSSAGGAGPARRSGRIS